MCNADGRGWCVRANVLVLFCVATSGDSAVVRLFAVAGRPLVDVRVRERVLQIAHELATKFEVPVLSERSDDRGIEMALGVGRIAAFRYIAEVRRLSNEWYVQEFDVGPLWPVNLQHDDEDLPRDIDGELESGRDD
jgi:hypothetical protein